MPLISGGVETATGSGARLPHEHGARARRFDLPNRIVDGRSGDVLEPESVFGDLLGARVIYISEEHGNPHHHAAQLAVIAGVYARDPSLAIGMEMFKRPFQNVLDAYLAGEIDAPSLIERSEWKARWGYDFELYRPILEFARAHHIAVRALNAPDEITRAVAEGGIAALDETERGSLPDLDLEISEHRSMVRESFDRHNVHGLLSFDHFYVAQVIWDETMAYEIAQALEGPAGPHRMIVLAGEQHVRKGLGIPVRAARRNAAPFRIVLPIMVKDIEGTVSEAAGDYLWAMARTERDLPSGAPPGAL